MKKRDLIMDRMVYFSRLRSGSGQGFALAFFVEPNSRESFAGIATRVRNSFEACFFAYDPDNGQFPDAHKFSFDDRLGAVVVLVGHPLWQNETYQLELVKRYMRGWFNCLDELSGKTLKGVVSIAYGEIEYRKPKEGDWDLGSFSGPTYAQAIKVIDEAICVRETWPKHAQVHRVAVNKDALDILLKEVPAEQHIGYDDDNLVMYGADWRDDLLR